MGNKPYAKPLGIHTAVGRAWLNIFADWCRGERLLNGEHMYRSNKVVDVDIMNHELMQGCTVRGHVLTGTRVSKYVNGRYATSLKVDGLSPQQLASAIEMLRGTDVWQELLASEPTIIGTPVLELRRFAQAPHQLLELLVKANHFYPRDHHTLQSNCDCPDEARGGSCKHVAALAYVLINLCEVDPLSYLYGLGIDVPRLLEEELSSRMKKKRFRDSNWIDLTSPEADITTPEADTKRVWGGTCADNPIQLE